MIREARRDTYPNGQEQRGWDSEVIEGMLTTLAGLSAPCSCSHLPSEHDIGTRKGRKVFTACSVHTGPEGTPCGCKLYTPGGGEK